MITLSPMARTHAPRVASMMLLGTALLLTVACGAKKKDPYLISSKPGSGNGAVTLNGNGSAGGDSDFDAASGTESGDWNGGRSTPFGRDNNTGSDLQRPLGTPSRDLENIHFEFDSFDLTPDGRTMVEKNARWLVANPAIMVVLRGHTDERGTPEYNVTLGERRALAVREVLMELGVAESRIETVSFGKDMPATTGTTEEDMRLNRRVEFFIFEQ